ncbi:MAG: hypothetical protein ACE5F9_12995 [Phycisphaerae bacterium]
MDRTDSRVLRRWYLCASGVALVLGAGGVMWLEAWSDRDESRATPLAAAPSVVLSNGVAGSGPDFGALAVESIRQHGYLAVTVHVALADGGRSHLAPVAARFGNGDDPSTNQYWGALYGFETHFANSGVWRRAYSDSGDGVRIVRRVVFDRSVEPSADWRRRGVVDRFDVYVLANAWRSALMVEAMEQPLREALAGDTVTLHVSGRDVSFGGAGVLVGYLGQNAMIERYWDPFAGLPRRSQRGQVGVFYACWKSAICLHRDVVEHGLYPVLFVRSEIVPEAYLVDGLLGALVSGKSGDAFVVSAAEAYARYQRGVSPGRAAAMLFR